MKIGQVTYCGNNYGSVLQCYATQMFLRKYGHDCELLTRSETGFRRILQSLEFRGNMIWKMIRYPKYFPEFWKCLRALNAKKGLSEESQKAIHLFIQTHIQRGTYSWTQLKRIGKSDEYSFFLSGSDQVWSARWFITNRIWFLRFCPRHKRVAWMPSFGAEQLAEYNRRTYAKYISEYAHLSVREEAGKRIVDDLLHVQIPALGDPVFLFDGTFWRELAAGEPRTKPYILMFFLDHPSPLAIKQAQMLQQSTGCELIYFSYDYNDKNAVFLSGGPEQFLHMIDHAQAVLTDSFHACAFSTILHTPFYAFSRTSAHGASQMSRIVNFLNEVSMPERYISTESDCSERPGAIPEMQADAALMRICNGIHTYLDEVLNHYRGETV